MSVFVIKDPDGTEQFERPTGIAKARRIAKQLYKDANPDVAPYVKLFFHVRRDGTSVLCVDDGMSSYTTGIEISRGK